MSFWTLKIECLLEQCQNKLRKHVWKSVTVWNLTTFVLSLIFFGAMWEEIWRKKSSQLSSARWLNIPSNPPRLTAPQKTSSWFTKSPEKTQGWLIAPQKAPNWSIVQRKTPSDTVLKKFPVLLVLQRDQSYHPFEHLIFVYFSAKDLSWDRIHFVAQGYYTSILPHYKHSHYLFFFTFLMVDVLIFWL